MSVIEDDIRILEAVFPGLDLVAASVRFRQLGRKSQALQNEFLDKGYPRKTGTPPASSISPPASSVSPPASGRVSSKTSADFMKTDDIPPRVYADFASRFLENEFPKLKSEFIAAKLSESNSHIYPVFRFIFKKYCLCDYVPDPADDEATDIYQLDNEVKNSYDAGVSRPNVYIAALRGQAIMAYPPLLEELKHIDKKRLSYQKKIAKANVILDQRRSIFEAYAKKKTSSSGNYPNVLVECPFCTCHYQKSEIFVCEKGLHPVCLFCLKGYIKTDYLEKKVGNVTCIRRNDCKVKYSVRILQEVLGPKKYKKLDEIIVNSELKPVDNLKDIYKCPFCNYRFSAARKPEYIDCPHCVKKSCVECQIEHPDGICPVREKRVAEDLRKAKEMMEEQQRQLSEKQRKIKNQHDADEAFVRQLLADAAQKEELRKKEEARLARERAEEAERKRKAEEERKLREEEERKRIKEELEADLLNFVNMRLSEAIIRKCPNPKCGLMIRKKKGCNYIACSCKTGFCYECQKPCEETTHFTPRGQPGCTQFVVDKDEDKKLLDKAKIAAEAEWRRLHPKAPAGIVLKL